MQKEIDVNGKLLPCRISSFKNLNNISNWRLVSKWVNNSSTVRCQFDIACNNVITYEECLIIELNKLYDFKSKTDLFEEEIEYL